MSTPTPSTPFIARNHIFGWIALGACLLLLIPLGAMQLTTAIVWGPADFAAMGMLLFVAGSGFVLAARRVPRRWRPAVGAVVAAAFLYIWAELAVGVFTNLGS